MKTKERIESLKAKHPALFKDGGPRSGFYIGEGWMPIVENLCTIIDHHLQTIPEELRADIYVAQVKEKFGILCFYMNQETPYISGAIALAEYMSHSICEECGKPGVRRMGGWVRTLCDKHHKANENRKAGKV